MNACSFTSVGIPTIGSYGQSFSDQINLTLPAPPVPTLTSVISNAIGAPLPFNVRNDYLGPAQLQFLQNNPDLTMGLLMGGAAAALPNVSNTPLQIPVSKTFSFGSFTVRPYMELNAGTIGQPQNPFTNPKSQYGMGATFNW